MKLERMNESRTAFFLALSGLGLVAGVAVLRGFSDARPVIGLGSG